MSQNLVPIFCGLGGNTLTIGGTVVNGIAILYSISTVSSSLMDFIKTMPKLIDNPNSINSSENEQSNQNTDNTDNTNSSGVNSRSSSNNGWINKFSLFAKRSVILGASIGIGLSAKKLGNYISSDEGIKQISDFVGAK
jgi:hypothetical protein